ncbi:hypothetical protein GCM10012319_18490 [Comamonas sp. KCTC 72670]|nr:hypothetical protein GCM10012319_18490 [Comamonas sp. KCTC 72670]
MCTGAGWVPEARLPAQPLQLASGWPDLEPSGGLGNTCFAVPSRRWRAMYRHSKASERDHWETFAVSLCTATVDASDPIWSGQWISGWGGPLVNEAVDFSGGPR